MTKEKKEVQLPFGEKFKEAWEMWKDWKQETFKFKYKTTTSEQTAIMDLVEISGGDEAVSIAIIRKSIGSQWKGLHPLKTIKINERQSVNHAESRSALHDALNKRFGNGG